MGLQLDHIKSTVPKVKWTSTKKYADNEANVEKNNRNKRRHLRRTLGMAKQADNRASQCGKFTRPTEDVAREAKTLLRPRKDSVT